MAHSPPSPELVEAYNLIKAGQRQEAGRILKRYLAQHKDDPQAWWLMSHAVSQPETVRRCLETVLKLDPDHAKARVMLERVQAESGTAPAPQAAAPAKRPAAPAPQPAQRPAAPSRKRPEAKPPAAPVTAPVPAPSADHDDDFPDDELVLGGIVAASVAAPAVPPPPPPAPEAAPPASFEEFAATPPGGEPAGGDPFAGVAESPPPVAPAAASEDLFAPSNVAASGESYNPFDAANVFDPAAHAKLGGEPTSKAQSPGSGNQPEWGPGLAFVPDATEVVSLDDDDDFDYERVKPRVERIIRIALAIFAIVVVIALILWYLDSSGWITLRGDTVPTMTTMDGGSFTVKYPKGWDMRCEKDPSGYPVCGIANHPMYNEVDYFSHQDIDIGSMISQSFGMMFSGENLPEEQFSIIVMDVPRTSPSYDNGSWAKTMYEWSQTGWFYPNTKVNYDRKEMTIDGYTAYYYEYTSQSNSFKDAAWDVYIEHDGIMLWMRVAYYGPRRAKFPVNTVKTMVRSIDIKPVEEW